MKVEDIKKGLELTIVGEIVDIGGHIILSKGQKVKIEKADITPIKWSNFFNMYMPARLNWIKLKGIYGHWFAPTFEELKHLTNPT